MAQVSPSGVSCAQVDDSFGPHAANCRGGFDFTLLFEETILTLLPVGLLVLALPFRGRFLLRKAKKITKPNYLATLKLSAWAALASLQLTALILWTSPSAIRTRTSVAASAVSLVSTLGIGVFSYIEHYRTVRPSTLLGLFLSCTLLFDIAHVRTLWLRAGDWSSRVIAAVATAAAAVKAVTLILEAAQKRRLLGPKYRAYPSEAISGIYSRSFFLWLNPLFRSGFSRVLEIDDLFVLDKHLEATYCHKLFLTAKSKVTGKSPHTLLLTAFGVLKWPIIQTLFPRACLTALMFCQPFLINRTIRLSQEAITTETTQAGYGLIGAYFLVYVGIAVSMGQYQHRTFRTIAMLRGGLISMIYHKTSTLQLKNVDPAASMTLMSADMERIVQGWQTMHEIWSNIAEVGIAIFLLEQQLGVACVVPVAVSLVSLLGSMFAMNFIMSRQAMWLEAIEKRISATSAMLSSIKGIKMCGLSETLLRSLQELRVDELRISKRFRRLIIWNMVFGYTTQVFAPVLTFAVFSVRARDTDDKTLDTARVFTSLSLFALLSEPLASLVMALVTFLGAAGSFARIQQFLGSDERVDTRVFEKLPPPNTSDGDAIVLKNTDIGWESAGEKPAQLRDISLRLPRHRLSMIIGPVGCGKTTLVQTILGEIPALSGSILVGGSRSVAYCAQNPWHMNGTIRQAIVGTEAFDSKWYNRVVDACALKQDFAELPAADSSRIGSGGIALSGGQSQRIALARAVYARREMVVLDDVLSGLDTTTENHVFHHLMGQDGIFRLLQCTVILISSSTKRVPFADYIVHIDADGCIAEQGTFNELNTGGGYISSLSLPQADWSFATEQGGSSDGGCSDGESHTTTTHNDVGLTERLHSKEMGSEASASTPPSSDSDTSDMTGDHKDDTNRRTGDVKIYMYYARSVGWLATLLFVIFITGFVFSVSFPTVWVQWWAASNESDPNGRLGYWLGVYAMFGGVAIVCLFLSCWQMIITMVPRSGEKFHFELLKTVLSAPMSFFVNTDSGVTMNRFSQDLQLIDMELPVAALNTFTTFILCIAQMALIGVGSIYAAVSFPVVLLALYTVQWFYLRTSRQLRLMDIEAKAPLYGLFEESLSGLATIRAFGWQDKLQDKNRDFLNRSQRPFYLLFAVQRWLTLVLDLIVAAVAVLLVVLVVQLRGTVNAGGVGLALLGVIQFSQNIKLLVTYWTMLEIHIGSVHRVRSFTRTTLSEDRPGEKYLPPPEWPAKGAVEIKNLMASYGSNVVLKNLSLSIAAGDKIGICGRTGSGKSSLLMTLFRLVDLQEGSIFIDGIDIATVPRQEVRRRLSGVPQLPFLLKGSVRLNADPFGVASDEEILNALECVQLSSIVAKNGGLDADVEALNLSSGQRQLFGLARALLRPSSILILDEATSSIDARTEDIVQRMIRKKFPGHTIIAVAHRLDTIMDFDKVAVLEAGRLVEFDSPYSLLEHPGSAFSRLYNAAVAEEHDDDEDGLEVAE